MGEMLDIIWRLVSGGATPEERKIGMSFVMRTGHRLIVTLALLYAYGLLTWVGVGQGFARADDVQAKIAAATQPITTQMAQQNRVVERLSMLVNSQLANTVSSEIRYLYAKKCHETNEVEKERLQREIDRKQDEFQLYRDTRYQYGCSDL